jgi:multidrug efflux pump subunit AcrA (membrane-fusion protein)
MTQPSITPSERPPTNASRSDPSPSPSPSLSSSMPRPSVKPAVTAPTRRRRSRIVERTLGTVAVAAIIGAGVLLVQATGDDQPAYRTADAATQTVQAALTGVATIEPIDQAIVGFPADGTVSTVEVALGDVVALGQQLATLDTIELERDLRAKQAALAQAQLVLAVALDGDDPSSLVQSSSQTPMGFADTALAAADSVAEAASDVDPELAAAQQVVLDAQHDADVALADAAAALDSAIAVCDAFAGAADPSAAIAACQTALAAVVDAQKVVSAAQDAVTAAADALDALLAQWAAELESSTVAELPSTPSTTPATTTPTNAPTSTPTGETPIGETPTGETTTGETPEGETAVDGGGATDVAGGASGPSGSTLGGGSSPVSDAPSSEDLIAYQFDVDAAQFDLEAAEQALAQAAIVSPIAGTVTSIDVEVGDEVTAGSSMQTIVVEGPDGYEATTTVSINEIADIHVTQKATIVPDGGTKPLTGKVTAIAQTPDPASSTTSYRVTIGFTDETAESSTVRNGNIGDVSIVTGVGTDAVAVPTSAVTLVDAQQMVTILSADGTATTSPVTVGVIGDEWTEILSGVAVGDTVVLANLDDPLPSSATDVDSTASNFGRNGNGNIQFDAGSPTFAIGPGG